MRLSRFLATLLTFVLVAGGLALPSAAAEEGFSVETLHFSVTVGPDGSKNCNIVGDLYLPDEASSTNRVPAIMTTNGFGGSKDDQAGDAKRYAEMGYAVLSYSGLGFGGSGCKITLDNRPNDGQAASQLVSYLGGKDGIAFHDSNHSDPAPVLDVIQRDTTDHDGNPSEFDPRVGMVGGSYGGHVQYAASAVDKRIDAIVPLITWNDLTYSLAPNNLAREDGQFPALGGAPKLIWALGFSALGMINGLMELREDPTRALGCPNFADFVCVALLGALTTGMLPESSAGQLRDESVGSFTEDVKIPTLIIQGQSDTLFNLNEAVATYEALKSQGTTVKMIWQNGGHSGDNAGGEFDASNGYITQRINNWFARYLKDEDVETGPEFSYFRDWIDYEGGAAPAYASSSVYPVGEPRRFNLSDSELTTGEPATGSQTLMTTLAKLPTSLDTIDVVGGFLPIPEADMPGTTANWTTPALQGDVDVVGSPELNLKVQALLSGGTQVLDLGKLVLFAKMYDVDPDGNQTLIRDLVAPIRVPDVNEPFQVTLPGFAHRFKAGHSIRLVLAGGSINYLGGTLPMPVTIATGDAEQTLTLPVVHAAEAGDVEPPAEPNEPDEPSEPTEPGDDSPLVPIDPGADNGADSDDDVLAAQAPLTPSSGAGGLGDILPKTGGPAMASIIVALLLLAAGTVAYAASRPRAT